MATVTILVDNLEVKAEEGSSILEAARKKEIYIPSLCYHPDLPPSRRTKAGSLIYRGEEPMKGDSPEKEFEGCNLCLVEVEGQAELVPACDTLVKDGMKVFSKTERLREARRENLMKILTKHPHACLICAQKEGCTREPCSTNVPIPERCCPKFGNCELEKVAECIGIRKDTPRYVPANLPVVEDEPLFIRDYNLCIACTRCVRACQKLRGVEALGFVYLNDEAYVGSTASNLKDSGCRFCLACVEVCPTGALMDKDLKAGEREKSLVPCKHACPVNIDIPKYIRLISQGRYDEAAAVVRERVPIPTVLGHACARPCENECRSKDVNEAIAICALKWFAADQDKKLWKKRLKKASPTGKRVAVIGSGPAGLTAVYYLALQGHSLTVFETLPEIGGMLRYGIQEYRLPESVLEKDLETIIGLGVELKTNTTIAGSGLEDLKNEGYDATIVAMGLQESRILKVEGSASPDVVGGLDLLKNVRLGREVKVKDHVLVVGGGAVAIDVALTVLRLGAERVETVCLEKRGEMPAFQWEIEQAVEEGVKIHNALGVKRILCKGERVTGIELVPCISAFDDNGGFNPSFDESTTRTLNADTIIFAIGQSPDLHGLDHATAMKLTQSGLIHVRDLTMETSVPGVFACGDIVKGPSSLVEAVAQGRGVASAVDRYLGGTGNIDEALVAVEKPVAFLGREEGFAYKCRAEMPMLEVEKRTGTFDEAELGLSENAAVEEAKRCLCCDLRLTIRQPTLPPEKWITFTKEAVAAAPEAEGVFQLLDEDKNVIYIKGTINLRKELIEQAAHNDKAQFFIYEEAKMFTMRESELLQQYMKKHGKLPEQNIGLEDDLY
jgi:NADPH-dependent glutamate synthase beta subunit-like oxidoreductase